MKLWLAYVANLNEPFDPAKHCTDAEFSFRMSVSLGQLATVEIEREQTGWSLIAAGQPRNVLISESRTGRPADAVVRARARITGLPSDLLGETQTIQGVCAPADIKERLLDYCKTHLASGPETDFRFSDADPEDPESYLLGRSGWLQVDPATHAIRYIDDVEGETVHDLASVALWQNGRAFDAPGLYDPPASTYRATLDVAWTMEASGETDIAGRFYQGISTLDSGFAGRIGSAVSGSGADGWSLADAGVSVQTRTLTSPLCAVPSSVYDVYETTNIWTLQYDINGSSSTEPKFASVKQQPTVYVPSPSGLGGSYQPAPEAPPIGSVSPQIRFAVYSHRITEFKIAYQYSQPRSETAYVALSMPAQHFVLTHDEDPETIQLSLTDIFQDSRYPEWKTGEDYAKGDRVRFDDKHWECVEGHHSTYFDELSGTVVKKRILDGLVRYDLVTSTYWLRYFPDDLPTPATTYRYLDSPAGRSAMDHALCRLRKTARRNLLARHVTADFCWEDVAHVDVADSISLVLNYDGRGTGRRVEARLVTMEYSWDENGAVVSLEGAIPFGTGTEPPAPEGGGWADGYADDYAGARPAVLAEMDVVVSADPAELPVAAWKLSSPNYAVLGATVHNQSFAQAGRISSLEAEESPTEVSVKFPTWIDLRLVSLAVRENMHREIDCVATMLASPKGIDL